MPEIKRKRGTFDFRSKTALQPSIMKNFGGKQALEQTASFAGKSSSRKRQEDPVAANDNVLRQKLFTGQNVSLNPFFNSSSPTGVLSKSAVAKEFQSFGDKLNSMVGFESASVQMNKDLPTGLVLDQGFQKAQFKFNPRNLSLSGGKWELDIPENFRKVSDKKFVAPKKRYRSQYEYERDGDDRDKDKRYSEYNPAEVYLTDDNKLLKTIKRDILTDSYEREDDRTDGNNKQSRKQTKKPFTAREQFYYDTGLLKQQKQFGVLDAYEFEREVRGNVDEREKIKEKKSFLERQSDFTPEGLLREDVQFQPVDVLRREYQGASSDRFTEEEEKRQEAQLKSRRVFRPETGSLRRREDFGVIRARQQASFDDNTSEEIIREQSMLQREDLRADPNFFNQQLQQGETPSPSIVRDFFTITRTDVDDTGSTRGFTTTRTTEPGRLTYYNPLTGDVIDTTRLL